MVIGLPKAQSDSTTSINITNTSGEIPFDKTTESKKLKVQFKNRNLVSTANAAIEKSFETALGDDLVF